MSNELRQIISAPQDHLTRKFYQEVQAREAWFYYCLWYHTTSVSHQSELRRMRDEPNIIGWFYRNRAQISNRMAVFWLQISLGGGCMYGFFTGFKGDLNQNNFSPSSLPPTHYTQQPYTQYQNHLFCLAHEKAGFKVKSANAFSLHGLHA